MMALAGWDKGMEFALYTLGNKDKEMEKASLGYAAFDLRSGDATKSPGS
jgi:hypothetical protein